MHALDSSLARAHNKIMRSCASYKFTCILGTTSKHSNIYMQYGSNLSKRVCSITIFLVFGGYEIVCTDIRIYIDTKHVATVSHLYDPLLLFIFLP